MFDYPTLFVLTLGLLGIASLLLAAILGTGAPSPPARRPAVHHGHPRYRYLR